MLKQAFIIGVVCLVFGLAHGLVGGLKMPKEAKTNAPEIIKPDIPISQEDQPKDAVISDDPDIVIEEVEPENKDEFTVELLFEYMISGQAMILDARTEEEYNSGHIPSALHMPLENFNSGLPEDILYFDPSGNIIVYCSGGDCHASHSVASLIGEYGYENVFVFEKGFVAWEEAGFEVEQ